MRRVFVCTEYDINCLWQRNRTSNDRPAHVEMPKLPEKTLIRNVFRHL